MKTVLKNLNIYQNGKFVKGDIALDGNTVSSVIDVPSFTDGETLDFSNKYLFPGLVDVHVHLRDPGFSYKETIKTGTMAAAHGGYTEVCAMPNLKPVPDCLEGLKAQLDIIERDAVIGVHPFGAITVGQNGEKLADFEPMAEYVAGYSDDGKGVQSGEMMENAMLTAKRLGKIISAHCEDNSLLHGGCIHDGEYARAHKLPGICSESEWEPIKRDLELAEKTGCAYHVCHISCRESVDLIRKAKKRGVNVTCETAPHYLLLDDSQLRDDGRYKMNPPIRSGRDRMALIEGLQDGTIDMIATDHAPHSAEEKSKGLRGSVNGIVGIETAFAACYSGLVKTGFITLEKLMALLHDNAKARFGIGTDIEAGAPATFTVFDLDKKYTIDSDKFLSMGKSTPFDGYRVYGRCLMTVYNGNIVWKDESVK